VSNRTFVVGVGMTKFEKPGSRDWDYPDMALEAGTKALEDAGIPYDSVEQAFVGYCYGGSLAWLAAARVEGISASSSYYGSLVKANAQLTPACPVIVHLGRTDPGIPADEVAAAVTEANPKVPVYIYEGAGHGFNNQSPERYNAEAADLARHRTLELFDKA